VAEGPKAQEQYKSLMAEHVVPFLRSQGFKGSARRMVLRDGPWEASIEHRKSRSSTPSLVTILRDYSLHHLPSEALRGEIMTSMIEQSRTIRIWSFAWDRRMGRTRWPADLSFRYQQAEVGEGHHVQETAAFMISGLRDEVLPSLRTMLAASDVFAGVVVHRDENDESAKLYIERLGAGALDEAGIDNFNRTARAVFAALYHEDPAVRWYACRVLNGTLHTNDYRALLYALGGPEEPPAEMPDLRSLHGMLRELALDDPDALVRREASRTLFGLRGDIADPEQMKVWRAALPERRRHDGRIVSHPVGLAHGATAAVAAVRLGVAEDVVLPAEDATDLFAMLASSGQAFWSPDPEADLQVWYELE
jgi:hypothetical protein